MKSKDKHYCINDKNWHGILKPYVNSQNELE